jgi:DNA polymerase III sliding clamp (beta) subunit (PCNA family)
MTQINMTILKAVAVAAGKEITRYYLNGVQIEITERGLVLVATDGHRLIAAQCETEPTQAPCKGIVPLDFINKIKIDKSTDFAELTLNADEIRLQYGTNVYISKLIDGTYPDWRRIVPKEASNVPAQFNPLYLADFAKAMKQANASDSKNPLPIVNHNGENVALVELGDIGAGNTWLGVIMPVRDKANRGLPSTSWL